MPTWMNGRASAYAWLAICLAGAPAPAQDHARFIALARAGADSFQFKGEPATLNFDADVVRDHAFALHLGAVEILYQKRALQAAQDLTDLQQCAIAICDMQRLLTEWITGTTAPPDVDAAHKLVVGWLKTWRFQLAAQFPAASDEQAAAQRQFTAAMARVLAREALACRAPIWLAPTRAQFMQMCALLGAIAPQNRELLWTDDVLKSSEGWASRPRILQIVAMEYSAPDELGGASNGVRMDAREKGGLLQHVVQRAASSLAVLVFGDEIDRDFEAGLCQNLVVALLKENNARTGGSGRGAYAAAREQFVAGGASSGGILPAIDLDSQWRLTKGRDFFVRPLKLGQKAGAKAADAKEAKDKLGSFQLQDDHGKPGHIVRAPFLGPPAQGVPSVPGNFDADYKEFLRAYRSGFVHWLREAAGKNASDSKQKFAAMLRELTQGGGKVAFELACRRGYGDRLSADGPTPSSLEWRFLAWLAK